MPGSVCDTGVVTRRMLDDAAAILARAGVESPRLDAELILAEAAHTSRARLIAGMAVIDDSIRRRFARMLDRRAAREPLAYILGHKEFYSLELEISPAVLIPRPGTEALVTAALSFLKSMTEPRVLDIGTGSGAIAIAIAANAPGARVVATDISADAIAIAERNADRLVLHSRIEFHRADCFDTSGDGPPLGRFDLIASNPPYIRDGEIDRLQPEVSRYEPRVALAGGADGMSFYRRIVNESRDYLVPGGAVMVEIGEGQSAPVMTMFRAAGFANTTVLNDLGGMLRVVIAR